MRGSGAGRRGGSAIRGSRARWSTAAVCRVSRSTLAGAFGSALRGSAAATGCRSAPACFVRAGFGSAFGGGAAATGRLRSGACFGPFSLVAGFVSALRGTVASTGGSGLVWVAVTDGAAGGFGASPAAAERSPAGAGLVWFAVTEDLDSGLRSSDAKARRSTPAGLAWPSGGAGFGLCSVGAATTGRSPAGAGFARLSTGAGLGSDFGGSTAATGRSAEGFGVAAATTGCSTAGAGLAWFTAGGSAGFAFEGSAAAAGRSTVGARFARLSTDAASVSAPVSAARPLQPGARRTAPAWPGSPAGGGADFGFGGSAAAAGRSPAGACFAWLSAGGGAGFGSGFGGAAATTGCSTAGAGFAWFTAGGSAGIAFGGSAAALRRSIPGVGAAGFPPALGSGAGFGVRLWRLAVHRPVRALPRCLPGRLRLCFRRRDRSDRRPASGTLLPGIFRKRGCGRRFCRLGCCRRALHGCGLPRVDRRATGARTPSRRSADDSRPRPAASAQPSAAPRPGSPD